MKTTITQIAKKLGIHHATVSRALRDNHSISEDTRRRVRALAKELGYKPNLLASGLSTRKTYNIGLVVADITAPFFSEIARGAEDTVRKSGYNVFTCNTDGKPENEKLSMDSLVSRGIEGVIIASSGFKYKYLQGLLHAKIPLVFIDRYFENLKASYVTIDHFSGGYQMTKYLLSLGHRRIAYIRGEIEMGRFYGYKQALKEYGIKHKNSLTPVCNFRIDGGERAAEKLVQIKPLPTAIFCANDLVALGAMKVIKNWGFRIPEDISLTGFDNDYFTEFLQPPLTTIHQPKYELGQEAARILLDEINGKLSRPRKIKIKPVLVIRDSCAPL